MSTYTPRWRLASWDPSPYSVEVEGERGRVLIPEDGMRGEDESNQDLWIKVCDELTDCGHVPPPDADEDWSYPPEALAALQWNEWNTAPWHVRTAILARQVEALTTERDAAWNELRLLKAEHDFVKSNLDYAKAERDAALRREKNLRKALGAGVG